MLGGQFVTGGICQRHGSFRTLVFQDEKNEEKMIIIDSVNSLNCHQFASAAISFSRFYSV